MNYVLVAVVFIFCQQSHLLEGKCTKPYFQNNEISTVRRDIIVTSLTITNASYATFQNNKLATNQKDMLVTSTLIQTNQQDLIQSTLTKTEEKEKIK